MTTLTLPRPRPATLRSTERRPLPAWPLYAMIAGYPVEWALGAAAFGSILIAVVMLVLLALRGRTQLVPGVVPWFVLLAWVVACAATIRTGTQAVGYVQIFGQMIAAGIALLYLLNARERMPLRRVLGTFTVLWLAIVVLGILAIRFPDLRLTTPVSYLVPQSLKSNDLVYQYVYPRMAEVQQPWGAAEPFNRPAAPFPYANSWGAAYALLTPVVIAYLTLPMRRAKKAALVVALVVSLWPAVETSNRGMFVGLGVAVAYVVVRLAVRGRVLAVAGAVVVVGSAALYLVASGSIASILGRQQYSDSTSTRSNVYLGTFDATVQSPFLGWATPQSDSTIGTPLGTQGELWLLMFSYGFVGLGLFLLFLFGAIGRTWAAPTTTKLWLHAVLISTVPMLVFYSLNQAQLLAVLGVAGVLLRSRYRQEAIA